MNQDLTPEERRAEHQLARLIEAGETWVRQGDEGKWKIGHAANLVARKWERRGVTLIAFANLIRLARPESIYEIAGTEALFPKRARANFDSHVITWSHYRAAYRRVNKVGADFEDAMDWLKEAHDNERTVAEFEEDLRGGPGGDWLTKRERFGVTLVSATLSEGNPLGDVQVTVPASAVQRIHDAKVQRNFRLVLTAVYDIAKVK